MMNTRKRRKIREPAQPPANMLLYKARRVTGLKLLEGPYTDTELQNLINDYRKSKQYKEGGGREQA